MNKIKDVKSMDQITHSVRRSQAVLQYGVGAMIDFPSQVLMTALPEEWKNPEVIHDERLEKLLGVHRFITPSDSDNGGFLLFVFPVGIFARNADAFNQSRFGKKNMRKKASAKAMIPTLT